MSPANGGCCGPKKLASGKLQPSVQRRAFVSRVIVSSAPNLFEEGRRIDDRPGIRARSWWHPSRSNKSSGRDESLQNSMNALRVLYYSEGQVSRSRAIRFLSTEGLSSAVSSSRNGRFRNLAAWQMRSKEGLTLPRSSRLMCFGSTSRALASTPCLTPAAFRAARSRFPNSCASVTGIPLATDDTCVQLL